MLNPITIITFHHISPERDHLTVPPQLLETTLLELKKRYTFISYDEFKHIAYSDMPIPNRHALVTLDDGYLDNYLYAFPILRKLSVPTVVFIVTGHVKESNRCRNSMSFVKHKILKKHPDPNYFINTKELAQMHKSGLMAFASHTDTHLICRDKSEAELSREFEISHKKLKSWINDDPPYGFCWPAGVFDDKALTAIAQSPYKFAFSTRDGGWYRGDNLFTIRRIDCSSYSGDPRDYSFRLKKKLWIYSSKIIGRWYRTFKDIRENAFKAKWDK
jgi:peptidoglycan/xylan/chitin deacetylase (PgdA/CDA1 family)